jgi:hypothetical protein
MPYAEKRDGKLTGFWYGRKCDGGCHDGRCSSWDGAA